MIVVASLICGAAGAESGPEKLAVGALAPLFTLKALNSERVGTSTFSLRNYVGDSAKKKARAIVLSFAASYCVPCKKELPELKRLAPEFRAAGVEVAVIVIDTEPQGQAAMKKLCVDELDLPFFVLSDRYGILARRYHADQLPMTVVIDPATRRIQWLNVGFQEDAVRRLEEVLGLSVTRARSLRTPHSGR